MPLKKTITAQDLKHYITSSKSCKFTNDSIQVEQKHGILELHFDQLYDSVCIFAKRSSGNGKVTLIYDGIVEEKNIISKLGEKIELSGISQLKIERDQSSLGIIEILSIDLYTSEENYPMQDWKSILSKAKSYKCIRIANGKLYAAEGALIIADGITTVSTQPPNMFKINGDTVKFLGSCEITELTLNGTPKVQTELYPHLGGPPHVITVIPNYPEPIQSQAISMTNSQSQDSSSNILYSGSGVSIFKLNSIQDTSFNGRAIIFGHKGSVSIPITGIEPATGYIIIVETSKIDGNGKLQAYISPSINDDPELQIVSEVHRALNFKATSSSNTFLTSSFKLIVERPHSATGAIAISKITLIKDIGFIKPQPAKIVPTYSYSTNYEYVDPGENIIKSPIILNRLVPSSNTAISLDNTKDKKFVIVIPSYNNQAYAERNMASAQNQKYNNFRIIFIDDCSTDRTFEIARKATIQCNGNLRTTLVRNTVRKGALENLYDAIHSCDNDSIVLLVDGDDWLAHDNVLTILNDIYKSNDIWLTYGQYQNSHDGNIGISQEIPGNILRDGLVRQYVWCSSHLRTGYSWLFKQIKKSDLTDASGKFYEMAWDMTLYFPLLEMAREHSKFINEILYVYNMQNPISDHVVNRNLQMNLDGVMRRKQRYAKLEINDIVKSTPDKKTNVGLMIIATGRYHTFIGPLLDSADTYFLGDTSKYNVTYFIFSDKEHVVATSRNVKNIHIEHCTFPYATLNRYKYFTEAKEQLSEMDYLYYVDVDTLFVDQIDDEIIGDIVAVKHCGFWSGGGSYEDNPQSVHYIDHSKYKYYAGGGWQGGSSKEYLDLAKWCYDHIEEDLKNGIMLKWHDESSYNRYLVDHSATVTLTPSYHHPQDNTHFKPFWQGNEFPPKILLLEKDHTKARS